MGIREHRGPEVSVLWLGTIVVSEDVTQRAPFRCSDQSATLADKPSCQSFAVGFGALGELADDGAGLVPALEQPDLSLILEGDDRLPDFERSQQARLCEEGKKLCWGPTAFGACEVPPKPDRDDGMAVA